MFFYGTLWMKFDGDMINDSIHDDVVSTDNFSMNSLRPSNL